MDLANAERFLVAFNKIDKYLDSELDDTRYVPFHNAVHRVKKVNAIVNRYHHDLHEFSELRNAIVHERTELNYTIADPHDDIVDKIERIAEELTAPKRVIPTFKKTLRSVASDLKLKDVLGIIRETDFSQFPVYSNKQFVGLLTDKGITHWLAQQKDRNIEGLLDTTVSEIIKGDHRAQNYQFIAQDMTIHDAEQAFINQLRKYKRIDAFLITEKGKSDEQILGMISTHDLIEIP